MGTDLACESQSDRTRTFYTFLPSPAWDNYLALFRCEWRRGLLGRRTFRGTKRRGSFEADERPDQLSCLIQSPKDSAAWSEWVIADAAGSACFEFLDQKNPLVHLYGSEQYCFPRDRNKECTCCASCTHMCWWACTFPKRACMVRYPGETQRPAVPGRPHEGLSKSCSSSRL